MTRFSPTLILNRLIVLNGGHHAYDERFHLGVNIIRGVPGEGNSVGKSTIADLIFFALGGDLTKFKDEAQLCDFAIAEVSINAQIVTLRREINETSMQPMWIFFGDFDATQSADFDKWERFPYRRYGDRESFTQVLFRLLNLPEVPSETASNITMHQILRLMYVDQMTPVDRIFRFEANDSAHRRQAVGDLLCGSYDERIYPAQISLREKERSYEQATQQYNALIRFLTAAGEGFNIDLVDAREANTRAEIDRTEADLSQLRGRRFRIEPQREGGGVLTALKRDLDKVNSDIIAIDAEISSLSYGVEDAALLIAEIEKTLTRLKEGEIAGATIGPVSFTFCPSCFAPLDRPDDGHSCQLCHSPMDPGADRSRSARMRNELEVQLKESRDLQEKRKRDLIALNRKVSGIKAIRDTLSAEYIRLGENFLTEADAEINQLTARIGYLQRELVETEKEKALALQLASLSQERATLNEDISHLGDRIKFWRDQRDRRQAGAYGLIMRLTANILSKDLHTEAEFAADSNVYFNFAEDRITVNGKSGFSASSLTVLRNAFHVALQWASCTDKSFRYPRFLLLDNIEDKGMTEARSRNFQQIVVEISNNINIDHQIIFTTSMIHPELDNDNYTIGDKYDFAHKSLRVNLDGLQ